MDNEQPAEADLDQSDTIDHHSLTGLLHSLAGEATLDLRDFSPTVRELFTDSIRMFARRLLLLVYMEPEFVAGIAAYERGRAIETATKMLTAPKAPKLPERMTIEEAAESMLRAQTRAMIVQCMISAEVGRVVHKGCSAETGCNHPEPDTAMMLKIAKRIAKRHGLGDIEIDVVDVDSRRR